MTNIDSGHNKGDEDRCRIEEFLQIYSVNQNRIYAYILSLVPNSADADDIAQETTTVMWRKFDQFQPGTDFVAWGVAIARYQVLEYRKRHKKTIHFGDDLMKLIEEDSSPTTKKGDYRVDILKSCVKKLSGNDQTLIHMRYHEEMPVKTIAARVGKNFKSVYRILAQIHESLLLCIRQSIQAEELS